MKISAILPVAGVLGGIYSGGFLFGYNYHKRFAEEEEAQQQQQQQARGVSPSPTVVDSSSSTEDTPDSQTFSTNNLIYEFGLPKAGPTLHYANHVVLYDQVHKTPRWVAETLTEDNLKGGANRKHSNFIPDPNLSEMFRAGNEDFKAAGRGWSRGHMAAAGNMKINQDAMDQSFLLSNILPQNYENNAGFWNRMEMYCRELTKRWNEVHVISGPTTRPINEIDPDTQQEQKFVKYRVIGDKEVAIPTHLYKIILCRGKKIKEGDSDDTDDLAMAGFMVPNDGISWTKDLRDFQLPVDEVERVAGLTFYPQLDRRKTADLCEADSCNLIKHDEFQLWIIGRQVGGAKTKEQLQSTWKKLTNKNLRPDGYLLNLLESKCEELGLNLSDVADDAADDAAAAAAARVAGG